jgi:3-deoxy-7-phosphoheptulonate synthase
VDAACTELAKAGLAQRLMIDASHANSEKKHANQLKVATDIGHQLAAGETRIVGVMIESHLVEGRQDLVPGKPLTYGQSITDACMGWDDSVRALDTLAEAVRSRRLRNANYSGK